MPKFNRFIGKMFGKRGRGLPESSREDPIKKEDEENNQIYVKALKLRSLEDLDRIKAELKSGNILIVRFTPLAEKSVEDIKVAINELQDFVIGIKGDIARLGEDRIVVTPEQIKIWREKTVISV